MANQGYWRTNPVVHQPPWVPTTPIPHRVGGGEAAGHFFDTVATELGPLGEMLKVGKHGPIVV